MHHIKKKKRKGFTLIELIIVIAVIGILVLLASPMLIGYGREAKLTQIKSDTKVAEGIMEHYLAINGDLPDELTSVDLTTPLLEGRLLGPDGLVTIVEGDPSGYVDVTGLNEVNGIKSKLDGMFVSNEMGRVYYIHTKAMNDSDSGIDLVVADDQVYRDESVETLASIWGEDAADVLALVTALDSMGVTPATQGDAYALYEDLKANDPVLLTNIISLQGQVWTSSYEEVSTDLNIIKNGVNTWLTDMFNSLMVGENAIIGNTPQSIDSESLYMYSSGSYTAYYTYIKNVYYDMYNIIFDKENGTVNLNGYERQLSYSGDALKAIRIHQVTGRNDVVVTFNSGGYSWYTAIHEDTVKTIRNTVSSLPESEPSISVHISTDAPILNSSYDAATAPRTYPEAPWLGAYPGTWQDVKMATSGGKDIFLGGIDRYINDAVNVLTWDDIDTSNASYYGGNPAKRATLTPTAEGLLKVDTP